MQKTNIDNLDPKEKFLETKSIAIEGMTCNECVRIVEEALRSVKGVQRVEVDREAKAATVTFDNRLTDIPALHDSLLRHGYRATADVA